MILADLLQMLQGGCVYMHTVIITLTVNSLQEIEKSQAIIT